MRAGAASSAKLLVVPFSGSDEDLSVPPSSLSLLLSLFHLRGCFDQRERVVHPMSCRASILWASPLTFDLQAEQALSELSTFRLACLLRPCPYLTLCLWFPSTADSSSLLSVCGSTLGAGAASGAAQLSASIAAYLKGHVGIASFGRPTILFVAVKPGCPLQRESMGRAIPFEDATALF